MINYKPAKWKELKGDYVATITDVVVKDNAYFNPSEENSTESVLDFTFDLTDPATLESISFTQKFVAPLTGGSSLFQKLMDVRGDIPDKDGGEFDEQSFIGLEFVATLGKNKKNYDTIIDAQPISKAEQAPAKKEGETDLPF